LPAGQPEFGRFFARHGSLHDRRHVDFSAGRRKKVSVERKPPAKIRQHLFYKPGIIAAVQNVSSEKAM
jgi:hypothetical protein